LWLKVLVAAPVEHTFPYTDTLARLQVRLRSSLGVDAVCAAGQPEAR